MIKNVHNKRTWSDSNNKEITIYVYGCFTYIYECAWCPLRPEEAVRSPRDWNYKLLWVTKLVLWRRRQCSWPLSHSSIYLHICKYLINLVLIILEFGKVSTGVSVVEKHLDFYSVVTRGQPNRSHPAPSWGTSEHLLHTYCQLPDNSSAGRATSSHV